MPDPSKDVPQPGARQRASFLRELGSHLSKTKGQWLGPLIIALVVLAIILIFVASSDPDFANSSWLQSYR